MILHWTQQPKIAGGQLSGIRWVRESDEVRLANGADNLGGIVRAGLVVEQIHPF